MFALLAGVGWACFVMLSTRIGKKVASNDGLAIGMVVAAILMIPLAVPVADELIASPMLLLAGIGVALLSTTIPFTLEFSALKRLSARTYSVLISLEPAVAAVVGALLLGERIGAQGLIAVGCVVTAAAGMTLFGERKESEMR